MKTSDGKTYVYEKNQLIEVICQLRFPTILSIETKLPADFQDTLRADFPGYTCQEETPPGGGQSVKNHNFISADGGRKVCMTKDFIAFSAVHYTGWEDFAAMLDEPLGQFIRIYKPARFDRVGLRYLNGVSRQQLDLTDRRWSDLFQPQYLGILDDDAVDEGSVTRCSIDVERRLDERCYLKLHAGPGNVRRTVRQADGSVQTVQEQEARFILDVDVFTGGTTALAAAAETLETLHRYADDLFSDAITDVLHEAMDPVEV